jgi:predicted dehydrogenase
VEDSENIRLAMLGMVEGNGHPYSWSAIVNGFDRNAMAKCPYPVIPQYLNTAPPREIGLPGVSVTHIWCDSREDAVAVAKAARIPHIVDSPEEVIGQVDAVVIPTDKGEEHLNRALPFLEAGLPVFIDKPLAIHERDLARFQSWKSQGKNLLSTSCMRYAAEFVALKNELPKLGRLCLVTLTTGKSWERYGIHALEGVYGFLAPGGWLDAANTGDEKSNVVHLRHESGTQVVLSAIEDMAGSFGCLGLYGSEGFRTARFGDTFHAFRNQLLAFVDYLRTGQEPFPFSETIEQMKILIAGIRSREEEGRRVALKEIDLENPQRGRRGKWA